MKSLESFTTKQLFKSVQVDQKIRVGNTILSILHLR